MHRKRFAAEKAAEYIKDGMIIGLGTGSTAYYLINKVGQLVSNGIVIRAVATSESTEKLAKGLNIPLIDIDDTTRIDLAIDGVDEIDRNFNAIKGGGGSLFREKIVADLADEVIWILDENKLVESIGDFPLPVEILPYGYTHTIRELDKYSFNPVIRMKADDMYITDNGNYLVDMHIGKPINIEDTYNRLIRITGVLEVGLFINKCKRIIVGYDNEAKVIENSSFSIRKHLHNCICTL